MLALLLTTSTLYAPGAAENDYPKLSARQCESLLQQALLSNDDYLKRGFVVDTVRFFSRRGVSMSSIEKQRIAFLSATIVETAESWDTQSSMIWIVDHGLNDRSAPALCTAIRDLLPSVKKSDFVQSMGPNLMVPRSGASRRLEILIERLNLGVQTWTVLDGKKP
jgi:hypothetical protein